MADAFTLYATPLSANGRKVLAQVHHLGLEPTLHHVNVYRGEGQRPEYLAVNPSGKIPALVEGDLTLTESNAILQYVSEAHGGFRLSSPSPDERARIATWLFWEAAHWQPVLIELLSGLVGHRLLPDRVPPPASGVDWEAERLQPLVGRLEHRLVDHPYVALDRLTIADLSVAGMTTYFHAASFPFDAHPAIADWYGRIERLDAWRETAVDLWTDDAGGRATWGNP
jgi:glutathione S-transferase